MKQLLCQNSPFSGRSVSCDRYIFLLQIIILSLVKRRLDSYCYYYLEPIPSLLILLVFSPDWEFINWGLWFSLILSLDTIILCSFGSYMFNLVQCVLNRLQYPYANSSSSSFFRTFFLRTFISNICFHS